MDDDVRPDLVFALAGLLTLSTLEELQGEYIVCLEEWSETSSLAVC